jgi:hypothetical protein
LVALGVCLPSYGEILIYKYTETHYEYDRRGGTWEVEKATGTGYFLLEVTYNEDGTITVDNWQSIQYWKDEEDTKWFEVYEEFVELEIEKVEYKGKVEWLFLYDYVNENSTRLLMTPGKAYNKDIGGEERREVASILKGYFLDFIENDPAEGDLDREMSQIRFTLHSVWTKYANREDNVETGKIEGLDGDYDATVEFIKEYLEGKGYEEEI